MKIIQVKLFIRISYIIFCITTILLFPLIIMAQETDSWNDGYFIQYNDCFYVVTDNNGFIVYNKDGTIKKQADIRHIIEPPTKGCGIVKFNYNEDIRFIAIGNTAISIFTADDEMNSSLPVFHLGAVGYGSTITALSVDGNYMFVGTSTGSIGIGQISKGDWLYYNNNVQPVKEIKVDSNNNYVMFIFVDDTTAIYKYRQFTKTVVGKTKSGKEVRREVDEFEMTQTDQQIETVTNQILEFGKSINIKELKALIIAPL